MYTLVQDNDCHWYVIPEDKRKNWYEWRSLPPGDPKSWIVPKYAHRVDGPHTVSFPNWIEL